MLDADVQWVDARAAQELLVAEVERHVLALRELLVRGDENLKAWYLLNAVPFWAWDSPGISLARAQQREMVLHAIEPEEYALYYADNPHEAPFEVQYQTTVEDAMKLIPRFKAVKDWLTAGSEHLVQMPRIIDLSGNDGALAAGLSLLAEVTVLDLNPACVERARGRGVHAAHECDFRDGRRLSNLAETNHFDVAILFETVEHLADPVEGLRLAAKWAPILWVSTPFGAVEGLNLPTWGTVERKGHLHSFGGEEFRRMLGAVGEVEMLDLMPDGTMVGRVRVDTPRA